MKAQTLRLFEQMAQQIEGMAANPDAFVEQYQADAATAYRSAMFQAMKTLGYSDNLAANFAMSVTLKVNTFDQDVCDMYVNRCLIPGMKLLMDNRHRLEVQKHLTDAEFINSISKGFELTYQV